ncbi:hypothetical protein KIPB_012499, partial [Kipferlia bialata]
KPLKDYGVCNDSELLLVLRDPDHPTRYEQPWVVPYTAGEGDAEIHAGISAFTIEGESAAPSEAPAPSADVGDSDAEEDGDEDDDDE